MNTEDDGLKTILMTVANKLSIKKWRYHRKNTNSKVVNYAGNLISVLLVDKSTGEDIHLVIKRGLKDPETEKWINEVFDREVYVYTTLMPIFKSLDAGINYETLFPKCYYADSSLGNQVLVMNDMRTLGFVNYSGKYLDLDHMNVSLKAVARYHAMSIIVNEKKIELPNKNILRPVVSTGSDLYYSISQYCVQKYYTALFKDTIYSNFLGELIENYANYIDDILHKAKILVYGHGDFWKENILFEYKDKIPVRACLIDFQITRLMSPAQDVLFLIMNGTNSSTRRQYFKTLLSNYYNELKRLLYTNSLDINKVYPEDDFLQDFKLVFPSCFLLTFMAFIVWLGYQDLNTVCCKTEKNIPDEQRKVMEEQLKIMMDDLIADFMELGYIEDVLQ